MSLQTRTTEDLIQIARAGGGFRIDASRRLTADLILIARAASGIASITFSGMSTRLTDDLIQIARAGNGSIIFED